MIKVRVQLDGNESGYLTYTCKETMDEYLSYISGPNHLIGLVEVNTNALISIPVRKYVVEAWEIDDNK